MFVLYISWPTCRSSFAVPHMTVFWSSFMSCRPSILFRLFSERFWDGRNYFCFYQYIYEYHFCINIPPSLRSLCFKIFSLLSWSLFISWNCSVFYQVCSSLITTHFVDWFIVRDGCGSVRLLVSQYDWLSTY